VAMETADAVEPTDDDLVIAAVSATPAPVTDAATEEAAAASEAPKGGSTRP
jgi:hypothetical protein